MARKVEAPGMGALKHKRHRPTKSAPTKKHNRTPRKALRGQGRP